jgi:hypothetical protein
VIEREMTPALRGQIKHVRHLLEVTPAGETAAKAPAKKTAAKKTVAAKKAEK